MISFIDEFTIDDFIFETVVDENQLAFIEADTFAVDSAFSDLYSGHSPQVLKRDRFRSLANIS
jgi:hypothetical protein